MSGSSDKDKVCSLSYFICEYAGFDWPVRKQGEKLMNPMKVIPKASSINEWASNFKGEMQVTIMPKYQAPLPGETVGIDRLSFQTAVAAEKYEMSLLNVLAASSMLDRSRLCISALNTIAAKLGQRGESELFSEMMKEITELDYQHEQLHCIMVEMLLKHKQASND